MDLTANCIICGKASYQGINLSNGQKIHKKCIRQKQNNILDILNFISFRRDEISKINREIAEREKLSVKIFSLFKSYSQTLEELKQRIEVCYEDIESLEEDLEVSKSYLIPIYDFYIEYPPDWEDRKRKALIREDNRCQNCGGNDFLHIHHHIPLSRGGTNQLENLEVLCESCHIAEHKGRKFSYSSGEERELAFSQRLRLIEKAIKTNQKITFLYRKPDEKKRHKRTIKPFKTESIAHRRDNNFTLCVRGFCDLRQSDRTFAIKRMRGLKIL